MNSFYKYLIFFILGIILSLIIFKKDLVEGNICGLTKDTLSFNDSSTDDLCKDHGNRSPRTNPRQPIRDHQHGTETPVNGVKYNDAVGYTNGTSDPGSTRFRFGNYSASNDSIIAGNIKCVENGINFNGQEAGDNWVNDGYGNQASCLGPNPANHDHNDRLLNNDGDLGYGTDVARSMRWLHANSTLQTGGGAVGYTAVMCKKWSADDLRKFFAGEYPGMNNPGTCVYDTGVYQSWINSYYNGNRWGFSITQDMLRELCPEGTVLTPIDPDNGDNNDLNQCKSCAHGWRPNKEKNGCEQCPKGTQRSVVNHTAAGDNVFGCEPCLGNEFWREQTGLCNASPRHSKPLCWINGEDHPQEKILCEKLYWTDSSSVNGVVTETQKRILGAATIGNCPHGPNAEQWQRQRCAIGYENPPPSPQRLGPGETLTPVRWNGYMEEGSKVLILEKSNNEKGARGQSYKVWLNPVSEEQPNQLETMLPLTGRASTVRHTSGITPVAQVAWIKKEHLTDIKWFEGGIDFKCDRGYTRVTSGNWNRQCQECAQGTYWHDDSESCHPCPSGTHGTRPGHRSGVGREASCVDCAHNEYQDERGQTACKSCDPGKRPSTAEDTYSYYPHRLIGAGQSCIDCPIGTYGSNGECISCEQGYYQDSPGSAVCKSLPDNSTNEGATDFTCNTNYTRIDGDPGSSDPAGRVDHCEPILCPAGQKLSGDRAEPCTTCPNGTYSFEGHNASCTSCDANDYTTQSGSTSITDCLTCVNGHVNSLKNGCVECSPGTSSNLDLSSEVATSWGLDSPEDCISCYDNRERLARIDSRGEDIYNYYNGGYIPNEYATNCSSCYEQGKFAVKGINYQNLNETTKCVENPNCTINPLDNEKYNVSGTIIFGSNVSGVGYPYDSFEEYTSNITCKEGYIGTPKANKCVNYGTYMELSGCESRETFENLVNSNNLTCGIFSETSNMENLCNNEGKLVLNSKKCNSLEDCYSKEYCCENLNEGALELSAEIYLAETNENINSRVRFLIERLKRNGVLLHLEPSYGGINLARNVLQTFKTKYNTLENFKKNWIGSGTGQEEIVSDIWKRFINQINMIRIKYGEEEISAPLSNIDLNPDNNPEISYQQLEKYVKLFVILIDTPIKNENKCSDSSITDEFTCISSGNEWSEYKYPYCSDRNIQNLINCHSTRGQPRQIYGRTPLSLLTFNSNLSTGGLQSIL